MAKTKLSLMILGSIILFMLGALITYFSLLATDQISGEAQNIEITISDNEKEYDGTELNAENCVVTDGILLKGHKIEATYYGGITNVGVGQSNCSVKIVDESGKDHTAEYSISIVPGSLEVSKRPITLGIKKSGTNYDANKEIETDYDNDITDEIDYEIISDIKLCKGHRLVPDFETSEIRNVESVDGEENYGEADVSMVAAIYDINGFDVTQNYAISYKDNMKVKINKPTITLTTLSYSKNYDGEPFDESEINYNMRGELPRNYSIDVKYINNISSMVNVNDSSLLVIDTKQTKITDENGNDVTSNYKILAQNVGSLNITPIKLNIHSDDYTTDYDGREHQFLSFEVIQDENITPINSGSGTTGFILNGYEYKIEADASKSTKIDAVGSKTNNIAYSITLVTDTSNDNLSSNFIITYDSTPIISVTRTNLTILTEELDVDFDATTDLSKYIVDNAKITPVWNLDVEFSNEFNIPKNFDPVLPDKLKENSYNIPLTNFKIEQGSKNVTSNFNIGTTYLTLNLKKKVIYATSYDYKLEYDGNVHQPSESYFELDDTAIGSDYIVSIDSKTSVTDFSDNGKENKFTIKVKNGENDVTDLFNIVYTYGKIKVTKTIKATSLDYSTSYTGNPESAPDTYFVIKDANNETITSTDAKFKYEIYNKASISSFLQNGKENSFKVRIKLKDGDKDITDNCEISYEYGSLSIERVKVTATSPDISKEYTGESISSNNDDYVITGLPDGFDKEIINKASMTNVGQKDNTFGLIITQNSVEVTSNFSINLVYGKITITKKEVTATSLDYSTEYTGGIIVAPDNYFSATIAGFTTEITNKATMIDAGQKANTFGLLIYKEGENVTSNFNITYSNGILKVLKKKISVTNESPIVIPYNCGDVSSYIRTQLTFSSQMNSRYTFDTNAGTNTVIITDANSNYEMEPSSNSFTLKYEALVTFNSVQKYNSNGDYIFNTKVTSKDNASLSIAVDTSSLTGVGTFSPYGVFECNNSDYVLVFNQNIVIEKMTLYVKWKSLAKNANYTLQETDCTVTDENNQSFGSYSVIQETILKPESPFGTAVSYCGMISVTINPECYTIQYIPGVITFN